MSMKARQNGPRLGQQTHGSYCSARRTAGRLLSLETNSWLIHLVYSPCPRSAKHQLNFSTIISQYCIGGMMPDSASPVQQGLTVIEIRPYRGGWQCFEAPG